MKEGDIRITKEVCKRKECEECGELAELEHTFLLRGTRSNPQSKAYHKDDCSWCIDDSVFLCKKCSMNGREYKIAKEKDMVWCSTFPYENFPHLFLYWDKEKVDTSTP